MIDNGIPVFDRYIGIDYSGTKAPTSSLQRLRVYMAEWESLPVEVQPPPNLRKYLTRRDIAEWLVARRYRIGDYRLIYSPDMSSKSVYLLSFASRGSAYDA